MPYFVGVLNITLMSFTCNSWIVWLFLYKFHHCLLDKNICILFGLLTGLTQDLFV